MFSSVLTKNIITNQENPTKLFFSNFSRLTLKSTVKLERNYSSADFSTSFSFTRRNHLFHPRNLHHMNFFIKLEGYLYTGARERESVWSNLKTNVGEVASISLRNSILYITQKMVLNKLNIGSPTRR